MAETDVKIILTTFVTLLIAVVLIGSISGAITEKTAPTQITNQTFDISAARQTGSYVNPVTVFYLLDSQGAVDYQRGRAYIYGSFAIYNSSSGVGGNTIITAGNYTITYSGEGNLFQVSLVNTSNGYWATHKSNTTYIDYKYYQLSPSWARVVANIGIGMAAIAILGIVVGFIFLIYKKNMD
jgi:hypothetical protein